jgi:hypothetical protein
MVRFGKAV